MQGIMQMQGSIARGLRQQSQALQLPIYRE
jgi:hypothetical protein